MCTTLKSLGFKQTYSDAAVYIFTRDDVQIILPVFVDDMTFASKSLDAIKQAITDLTTFQTARSGAYHRDPGHQN